MGGIGKPTRLPMTKAEVSRRQLGVALTLYLDDLDPVSVHVLASGGREIAGELAKARSKDAFQLIAGFGERPGEWKSAVNRFWNPFKHATTSSGRPRDDDELLAGFQDSQNDGLMAIAWYDLGVAGYPLPPAAQVQAAWFLYRGAVGDEFERATERLGWPTRSEANSMLHGHRHSEQKQILRDTIANIQTYGWIADDPRTDLLPLILPEFIEYPATRPLSHQVNA